MAEADGYYESYDNTDDSFTTPIRRIADIEYSSIQHYSSGSERSRECNSDDEGHLFQNQITEQTSRANHYTHYATDTAYRASREYPTNEETRPLNVSKFYSELNDSPTNSLEMHQASEIMLKACANVGSKVVLIP